MHLNVCKSNKVFVLQKDYYINIILDIFFIKDMTICNI